MEDQGKNKGKDVLKPENSGTQLKVLVVDDDKFIRMTHQRMLEIIGVKNLAAVKNGKEAVDRHRNGESFDLILMDKDMPVMNGIEATKTLCSMGIHSKIIGVSSSCTETHVQEFMKAGLNDYYNKPLTVETLREILDKIQS
ncbi:Two-component response regulator ARR22 [Spatholobus suberectus]|nr:Two-component response regulator ARR22 [Spatholobus suberectus]